ncbi:hypothetical protein F5X68DRAFT_27813 [Plectosphaerella plurivora]|uniref:Protein SQS1 n=1 Tax=Plectosphaerella plurivora TaxID=936078 RepID=A0A9P8V7H3_9PEZI|nr:hypothetical protein F5X68DRAFT_27813 [Plectosphaerella plurivora]
MGMSRGNRQKRGGGNRGPEFSGSNGGSTSRNSKRLLLLGVDKPSEAFTLADEARSTAHGSTAWSKDSRLRSRPVSFVSAGCVDPLRQLEDQLQKKALEALGSILHTSPNDHGAAAQADVEGPAAETSPTPEIQSTDITAEQGAEVPVVERPVEQSDSTAGLAGCLSDAVVDGGNSPAAHDDSPRTAIQLQSTPAVDLPSESDDKGAEAPQSSIFFFDTTGEPSRKVAAPVADRGSQGVVQPSRDETIEAVNVSDSDNSQEEVILFKGRRHHGRKLQKSGNTKPAGSSTRETFDLRDLRSEIGFVDGLAKTLEGVVPPAAVVSPRTRKKREKNEMKKNKKNRKGRSAGRISGAHLDAATAKDDEDALIADYIANMQQQDSDEDMASEESEAEKTNFAAPGDTSFTGQSIGGLDNSSANGFSGGLSDDMVEAVTLGTNTAMASGGDETAAELEANSALADTGAHGLSTGAKPPRRSKAQLPSFMHLSDSELEDQLLMSFESSRLKKAEKRKEREKLRAQGMLGSKAREDDPRVKYQTGMRLDQIAVELRTFLVGNQASLTFPPLDNQARKVIHELANKFNIKSKSTGAGDQRRPTLYRTLRTFTYSEDDFEAAVSRVGRKYFPRRDRPMNGARPVNSHGGNKDLTYRDGEIVGGSAPELGEGNKGRLMLEKMGWSSGTALGTTSNKGILQPVEQKVKRGKAGLG